MKANRNNVHFINHKKSIIIKAVLNFSNFIFIKFDSFGSFSTYRITIVDMANKYLAWTSFTDILFGQHLNYKMGLFMTLD